MARKPIFSRPDGRYLKNIDPFMRFFPFLMKGRNESAIYFTQEIDITQLKTYLHEKNRLVDRKSRSTPFHAVLTALAIAMSERDHMNRFVIGRRLYARKYLNCAFVIKRSFREDAKEEIVIMDLEQEDTLESISQRIKEEVKKIKKEAEANENKRHGAVDWLSKLMNLPRLFLRAVIRFLTFLDYHGWLPKAIIRVDPMHTSIFISHLGSLGIDAPYHHLYEWGTTSVFLTIGAAKKIPKVMADGSIEIREVMNIALTLDERITDGFYFARSIKRFQQLLENPEQLDDKSRST